MKLVLGITGATGAIVGVRILEALVAAGVETHLVISQWGRATLKLETDVSPSGLSRLADASYRPTDMYSPIASGSFLTDGMIIAPCSMKTVAALRSGYADDLIARAADVTLKERRRLVIVPREVPLSDIHLENLLALSRLGVVVAPPMPAFYNRPKSIDDLVTHMVARVLDQFGLAMPEARRWRGLCSGEN